MCFTFCKQQYACLIHVHFFLHTVHAIITKLCKYAGTLLLHTLMCFQSQAHQSRNIIFFNFMSPSQQFCTNEIFLTQYVTQLPCLSEWNLKIQSEVSKYCPNILQNCDEQFLRLWHKCLKQYHKIWYKFEMRGH